MEFPVPLRPYQVEAAERAVGYMDGGDSPAVVLPTGAGKCACLATVGHNRHKQTKGRQLYVTHRTEIADQIESWLTRVTGTPPGREQSDLRSGGRPHVVAMVQTLSRAARYKELDPKAFTGVHLDEAHHGNARTWKELGGHFAQNPNCRMSLYTATPTRADGTGLAAGGATAVAYHGKVADFIRQGWLVPVLTHPVSDVGIDWDAVPAGKDGLLDPAELDKVLAEEGPVWKMVSPLAEHVGDRPTLVFCVGVKQASAVLALLNRLRPGQARLVTDRTADAPRRAAREVFKARGYQFLVNVGVYTEGVDLPLTAGIGVMRPCQSEPLAAQVVGRGMRPEDGLLDHPDRRDVLWHDPAARRRAIAGSSKPNALVVDLAGMSRRKLLTSADVLGLDRPAPVREYANRLLAQGAEGDVLDILDRAELEWSLIAEELERRQHVKPGAVRYRVGEVDLFDPRTHVAAPSAQPTANQAKCPSEAQLWYLVNRAGWSEQKARSLSRHAASAVITKHKAKAGVL